MTREEIMAMNGQQLDAAMTELRSAGEAENADFNALGDLLNAVEERRAALRSAEEARNAFRARMTGEGTVQRGADLGATRTTTYNASSDEFRTAWLKNLAVKNGINMFGDMNAEERTAFTFLTTNTPSLVPTVIMNRIVELVESQFPMYADATKSAMTEGFSIPRHKAIDAGDAAVTDEGAANDDEEDTFDLLPLVGVEIKKHLVISRKMKWQSIDAFQSWVENHIASRIGVAKEKLILSRLDNTTYGIAATNVKTAVARTDAGIRGVMALLKGTGAKVAYANNNTIWNLLAGIDDGAGNKAFIPNPTSDPVTQGRMYGASVKLDDNLADNVAYIGFPSLLLANEFEALYINHAMDPKTFEDIIAGYSLFDAGLENPKAFVKVTFANA